MEEAEAFDIFSREAMSEAMEIADEIYDETIPIECPRNVMLLALCMTFGIYYAHNEPKGNDGFSMSPEDFGTAMGAMIGHFSKTIKQEENPDVAH